MKLWRSKKGIPQWTFTQPQINQTSVLLNQDWTLPWTATWTAGKTRLFQAFWQLVGGCLPLEASTTGVLTLLENEVAAFRSCLRALVGSTSLSQTVSGMPPETVWIHQFWRKQYGEHLNNYVMCQRQFVKVQNISNLQCCSLWTPFTSTMMNIPIVVRVSFPIITSQLSLSVLAQPVTPPSSTTQLHPLVTSIPSHPVAPVPPA